MEKPAINYYPEDFLLNEPIFIYGFTPYNSTLRIEGSYAVELYRAYMPWLRKIDLEWQHKTVLPLISVVLLMSFVLYNNLNIMACYAFLRDGLLAT